MGYSSYYYDNDTQGGASGEQQQRRLREIYLANHGSSRGGASIAMDGTIRRSQPPSAYHGQQGRRSTGGIVVGNNNQRVCFYNEHRSNRFQGNRAIVGMDGTVQSLGSGSHHSKGRSSRSTSTTSSQRSPPKAVYMAPHGFDEQGLDLSIARSAADRRKRCCRKWVIAVVAFLLVGVLCGTIAYHFVGRKERITVTSAQASEASSGDFSADLSGQCQDGMIEERHSPHLAVLIRGLDNVLDESEQRDLEEAVWLGYNNVSQGCNDTYHRWMYNVKMLNQTVIQNVVLEDGTTPLQTLFDGVSNLLVHFEMKISCNRCNEENAFASIYPTTFGPNASYILPFQRAADGDYRRLLTDKHMLMQRRKLQVEWYDKEDIGPDSLDGGKILVAIENAAKESFSGIQGFHEAKIVSIGRGGSTRTMSMLKSAGNSESQGPSFFKDKFIAETKETRGCRKKTVGTTSAVKKKNRGRFRMGSSSSSSKRGKSADKYTYPSEASKSSYDNHKPYPHDSSNHDSHGSSPSSSRDDDIEKHCCVKICSEYNCEILCGECKHKPYGYDENDSYDYHYGDNGDDDDDDGDDDHDVRKP
jgi:hypothetical protein